MASVPFPGAPFLLNGQQYLVPSLSLKQFREHELILTAPIPADEAVGSQVERFMPVILLAINRNYPDVTLDQLYDWIDLNSFRVLFLAIQGASGLKISLSGEVQPA